jgi:hypothetical protein
VTPGYKRPKGLWSPPPDPNKPEDYMIAFFWILIIIFGLIPLFKG